LRGLRPYLCTVQGDYVVRDDLDGLVVKIGVVDAQIVVEPYDFVLDELARNEALCNDGLIHLGALRLLALKNGSRVSRDVLDTMDGGVAAWCAHPGRRGARVGSEECRLANIAVCERHATSWRKYAGRTDDDCGLVACWPRASADEKLFFLLICKLLYLDKHVQTRTGVKFKGYNFVTPCQSNKRPPNLMVPL
jgi:hypothetical protein